MRKAKTQFFHPYPKYLQVADILRSRVLTQMEPGQRIIPEIELSKQFGVSRETIRQALDPLEREGLITRSRGRGSFVAKHLPARQSAKKLTGLAEDFVPGLSYRVMFKNLVKCDEETAAFLRVPPEAFVVRVERISTIEDQLLAYHTAILPAPIGMRVLESDLEHNSIAVLLSRSGFRLQEDQQVIEAETADVQLAEHLGIPIGFPILLMRRLYISQGEEPIAYFKSQYRADRYRYTVALRQYDGHQRVVPPKNAPPATLKGRRRRNGAASATLLESGGRAHPRRTP